jgi:DNA-3-methyladenine glycosylase II
MQNAKKHLLKLDPTLKKLFDRHQITTFEPQTARSPFESLVRSIAHQQLHGKAAETILGRLLAHFPGKKFPTPSQILSLTSEQMRACGFSGNKVKSIRDIAHKTREGVVPTGKAIAKLDNEEIIARLISIYGVGVRKGYTI